MGGIGDFMGEGSTASVVFTAVFALLALAVSGLVIYALVRLFVALLRYLESNTRPRTRHRP